MQTEFDIKTKVENIYKECFGQNISPKDFHIPLSEAGLDSLDVIDFVYNIELFFDIKFNFDNKFMKKLTVQDLVNQVQSVT